MTTDNPRLNVYLGPLKKQWIHYCEGIDKSPSLAVKELMEQCLKESNVEVPHKLKIFQQTAESSNANNTKKQRFEFLLTPSEKAALEQRAQQEQCSQRRWVIHAIRAALTKQAQFSMQEIEVLGESNYQLLAIGRNLNQLAKAYHEGQRPSDILPLIEKLQQDIETHTKKVSHMLRASIERWDIE